MTEEPLTSELLRLEGWPDRLAKLIAQKKYIPFQWGQQDCALWAGDVILALTGYDHVTRYRGGYTSALGAARKLRKIDQVYTTEGLVDKLLGNRVHPSQVIVGDIVATPNALSPAGMSLGVCYGRNSLFVGVEDGDHGLVTLETLSLEYGWKIWVRSSKELSRA